MQPKFITIHCSATKPKHSFTVEALRRSHVDRRGWSDIGYHFYITTDGELHACRPLSKDGAHTLGHNANNIGICLEGGLSNDTGRPDNTYNSRQLKALRSVTEYLQASFHIDNEDVKGHRDWFEDINGDGVVDKRDWLKDCPCFSVKKWLENK